MKNSWNSLTYRFANMLITTSSPHPAYKPLRPPEEIRADILALERATEGLLGGILVAGGLREVR